MGKQGALARCLLAACLGGLAFGWAERAGAEGPGPASATATKVVVPASPSSVRGLGDEAELSVFSGQVKYGVTFDLPAGWAGFGPLLGLSYSGELGNGPVGVGWALSHSAIRRSTRYGVPSFSADDELELVGLGEGGRLVAVGPGEYRVEGQGNNLRVVREHNRFVVTDSDGTRYFFGLTAASRQQEHGDRIFAWFPELVVHRSGESVSFFYHHNRGQVYLSSIAWGPALRFGVVLDYEQRPDPTISFREGFRVETRLRLRRVQVLSSGVELRAYRLTYTENVISDGSPFALSRLASVSMTGYQGAGQLPELSLQYAGPSAPVIEPLGGLDGWQLEARGVAFFDVDGDGMEDLYRLEMGNHEYRKNLGGTFGARTPLPGASGVELESTSFMDLDGDARAELVRIVNDTWRYSRLVDGRWETVGQWPGTRNLPFGGPGVAVADLNGDGRMDVLEATTGGVRATFGGTGGMQGSVSLPPIDPSNNTIEPGSPNVKFVDMNGDGLADAVWMNDAWMKVFLGRGDGTFQAWRRTFYPWPDEALDIRDMRLADLDRDGLVDMVRFTVWDVLLYAGRADGSFSRFPRHVSRPEPTSGDLTVAIADANGNGSKDVVWSSPRGMWILDLAGATTAGMLERIDNGLGKVVSFEYAASAQLAVEAELAGERWTRKLPVSVPVPVRQTVDPGVGPARVVHHGVRDGFWDGTERRFGGFLEGRTSISGTSAADVRYDVTTFHPGLGDERVLRGRPISVRVGNGLGETREIARSLWAAHPIDGFPADPLLRVAVVRETRTSHHEDVSIPIETLTWFVHDGQGRVVEEHDLGRLDQPGDESTEVTRYATDDEVNWVRNRVCESELLAGDGSLVSSTRTYYGGISGTEEILCELGYGLKRRTDGWLAEEARWIMQSAVAEYSPHWNPLRVYEGGVWRDFGYDADDFHLESETVSPDTTRTLTWSAGWDPVRGLLTSVGDPSGVTTNMTYDELGRLATVAQANAPPHTRYEYDWTSPRPTTTTYVFDGPEEDLGNWPGGFVDGAGWRQTVAVANGAGDPLFSATRLASNRWTVSGWQERDGRGRTTQVFEAFEASTADVRQAVVPPGTPSQAIAYDAYDRVREHLLPTDVGRSIEYSAFCQRTLADDLGPITSCFDGKGRITRTERVVNGVTESVDATYDAAGRILSFSLQGGLALHQFDYDSLGRLTFATDPDIGDRNLLYNDRNLLVEQTNAAGQTIHYGYDGAARLTSVLADDGSSFTYHYDVALEPTNYAFTAGRLAWIEEDTGQVQLGYDAYGRQVRSRRSIVDSVAGVTLEAEERLTYAPSGVLRSVDFQDGLLVDILYDAAGRPVQIGDLWYLDQYDAAGRIITEHFGNGVTQEYDYDGNGQTERVEIRRPAAAGGGYLYDVTVTRNAYGAITTATDSDSTGLNHTAAFTYDLGGRLTDAAIGAASAAYQFHYAYDGLQNMVSREASGPTQIGALVGEYRYGEPRPGGGTYGPRQLTSVAPLSSLPSDPPTSTFEYDLAGRLTQQDGLTLTYNGLDQLTQVTGLPTGTGVVEHAYGYDGFRILTRSPDGTTQYWFTPGITERNGIREHYIRLGDRLIARVDQRPVEDGGGGSGVLTVPHAPVSRVLLVGLVALGLALLLAAQGGRALGRRERWARAIGTLAIVILLAPGCTLFGWGQKALWENAGVTYFHQGFSPGPMLLTREDGTVLEERRFEPFGEELDAYRELAGGGSQTGPIDYTVDSHNAFNKQTDPATGWSYHGARWMASETARWLTPDPPVKAPDPAYLEEPFDLNPYQYVAQNPVLFWDPNGHDKRRHEARIASHREQVSTLHYDWAGIRMADAWFNGRGNFVEVSGARWKDYMEAAPNLRHQVRSELDLALQDIISSGEQRAPLVRRFHAETQNGEGIVGYQFLHGTNHDAGGFLVTGMVRVEQTQYAESTIDGRVSARYRVSAVLWLEWNDVMDPNPRYSSDTLKSQYGKLMSATPYRIAIGWRSDIEGVVVVSTKYEDGEVVDVVDTEGLRGFPWDEY